MNGTTKHKIIILPAFLLMVAAQLYVPLQLVLSSENILEEGTDYKFRTASVYPLTPVQGSYILLTYYDNIIKVDTADRWASNEEIYVVLKTDHAGFASIDFVSRELPDPGFDFVKAYVDYVIDDSTSTSLSIRYPFNRFYLEAPSKNDEKQLYPIYASDSTAVTYALVTVKDGEAIVKDVIANEVSIIAR
jgi:hypothetical protein